jgi:flagellar FliJ protein
MSGIPVFEKILRVRENEKNAAQSAYHQSMDYFENIATKLYSLLKKKEAAEVHYQSMAYESIAIERLKEQSTYMEHLNNKINELQQQVVVARNDMETKQQLLSDAYIEVKKFEKLIENRWQAQLMHQEAEEAKLMDEISMQQYLEAKSGE